MSSKTTRWIFVELMRPVVLLGRFLQKIHRVLFVRRQLQWSIQADAQLARAIRRDVPFLFEEYAGKIVSDSSAQHPRPYQSAIVATDELLFRFVQGHGDLSLYVTSCRAPTDWNDIYLVLVALDEENRPPSRWILSWSDVTRLLRPHIDRLREAFSEQEYPATRERLSRLRARERAVIREQEIELNRRLYPDK
jgi:hypothetical protein